MKEASSYLSISMNQKKLVITAIKLWIIFSTPTPSNSISSHPSLIISSATRHYFIINSIEKCCWWEILRQSKFTKKLSCINMINAKMRRKSLGNLLWLSFSLIYVMMKSLWSFIQTNSPLALISNFIVSIIVWWVFFVLTGD